MFHAPIPCATLAHFSNFDFQPSTPTLLTSLHNRHQMLEALLAELRIRSLEFEKLIALANHD